ncbi:MAG: TIGR00269 family protein [Thermoplasmata archaeon]|nr:TIGR00269 family protein [Thermoplasmata archaeon]
MRCDQCSSKAITLLRYSGAHLCRKHFEEFFKKRLKKAVRTQCNLGKQKRIASALSGGKDSSIALLMLHEIVKDRRGSELVAVTVDEGIKGYRDKSIGYAKDLCKNLGIEHEVVSFKDVIGYEMDDIAQRDVLPCSYCGVFRRHCLNTAAKRLGSDVLATGLNLDDTVQSIFMNLSKADVSKLARLGPHTTTQKGLIPRIQPLRDVPEKEVYLYALVNDVKFHDGECPYADRAMRLKFRELVGGLEDHMPGTRHSILKAYDEIRPCLQEKYPPIELLECGGCGEPTTRELCKTCELKASLK